MTFYEFFAPVKILAGTAALEHLPFELRALGARRPLLVTDRGVARAGLLAPIEGAFAEAELAFAARYEEVPSDSSTRVVAACAARYRTHDCDAIVAVGGGSVIDTCKAVDVLVTFGGDDLSKYIGAGALDRPLRPFVAIPTTAGTGSEVTVAAVIADPDRGVKLSLTSPFLLPHLAVVDPRMTRTLPPFLTAATAMDALTHAVEACIGRARNPISTALAHAAIGMIARALPNVLRTPDDLEARAALAEAATIAGIAFSNSMTSLVHAIGHQLGAVYHLHHGLCMGLVLPYALEHNVAAAPREISVAIGDLLLPLAGAEVFARTAVTDRPHAAIAVIRRLRDDLHAQVALPRTLRETGKIERHDLPKIARRTLDDGALTYNPVPVAYDDVLRLLERAWE
jgi:alcohol dehydrogenase